MRTRGILFLVAGVALGGCLRGGPSLGGKLCKPGSGDCGGGMACVDHSATGQAFSLPTPGGVCEVAPLDCDPRFFDCPGDGGFWVCSKQSGADTCYASPDETLAGSLCMVDRGVCRTYGVFAWSPTDGGRCVTPPGDPQARKSAECWDAGGPALLCPCDGLDQDCDGVADDFDTNLANRGLAPDVTIASGAGCSVGDTYVLEPSGSSAPRVDGGPPVDSCATLSLTHGYALAKVEAYTTGAVASNTCSNPAGGTANALVLFGELDGGLTMLGTATVQSHTARFDVSGTWRTLLLCLSADAGAPYGISGLGVTRALGAPMQCDVP